MENTSSQPLTIGDLGLPENVERWMAQADIEHLDSLLLGVSDD